MTISKNIERIKKSVSIGDYLEVEKWTQVALDAKEPPELIMREGVLEGLRIIHDKYYSNSKVFPTSAIFLGYEAARVSLELLTSQAENIETKATIVLGTLEGDPHDVGSKWLALALLAGGYSVKYLGRDIKPLFFVHKALETDADVIAVSCHQTTGYKKIDELLKLMDQSRDDFNKEVFVMAGGSVITEKYAKMKGLGYATSAIGVVDLLDKRIWKNR
ncbi:MAG: cobalamin-dependent protein [Lentisphaeria bacterium]